MGAVAAEVRVRLRGAKRIAAGHPWVFRDDIAEAGDAGNGETVRVVAEGGAALGWAFWSSRSKIALRIVRRDDLRPDVAFWNERVDASLAWRDRVAAGEDAARLVFAESDGIPGLVVDRYGEHLVVQVMTAASERVLDPVLDRLAERTGVRSVLARNDASARSLEGLPREIVQLRGTTPERIEVREGGIAFHVDPWRGQKTGAFLDQRENRMAAAALAKGRVLDAFCYHGSFALQAALRGADVDAVDTSHEALARGRDAAERNGLEGVRFRRANVFQDLRRRESEGEKYDLIFLDPPAFAKSRADLAHARRGYKEINLRAMRILEPGGSLVTSSCSYNLPEAEFVDVVASAASDARRAMRLVERRSQSRDHPVRLGFPESRYLKCLILTAIE